MQAWYKKTRATSKMQGQLTPERLRTQGGWSKIKAKAAATRHLAEYALHVAQAFGGPGYQEIVFVCAELCR